MLLGTESSQFRVEKTKTDAVIDQFPTDRQAQIRIMLSESLGGVIAQTLCRKIGGGRAAALEVLIATQAVSNLIREGKTFQILSMMQVGRGVGTVVDKTGFEALLKSAGLDARQRPQPVAV